MREKVSAVGDQRKGLSSPPALTLLGKVAVFGVAAPHSRQPGNSGWALETRFLAHFWRVLGQMSFELQGSREPL